MSKIYVEKDSDNEYSVSVDGILIGTYFPDEGIVLYSSEGSTISLDDLSEVIKKLRKLKKA
jgi:hypothetical protein